MLKRVVAMCANARLFGAEGFAVVSASPNVVVELISIAIRVIRGHCDASDRENCEILLGRHLIEKQQLPRVA